MTTVLYPAGELNRDTQLAIVLIVSPFLEDHDAVQRALSGSPWQISVARDFAEAMDVLETECVTTVICYTAARAEDWRELLRAVKDREDAPAFILASAGPDEHLWAEVLNLGGYDVLPKPFDHKEIDRVLTGARTEIARRIR